MSNVEIVKDYVGRHKAPYNTHYTMSSQEALALAHKLPCFDAISLAFAYGKAKGYRQAMREAEKTSMQCGDLCSHTRQTTNDEAVT